MRTKRKGKDKRREEKEREIDPTSNPRMTLPPSPDSILYGHCYMFVTKVPVLEVPVVTSDLDSHKTEKKSLSRHPKRPSVLVAQESTRPSRVWNGVDRNRVQ